MSGGTYSLTSTPNYRIFEKLFRGRFIYSQRFCQKSAGKQSPKKYIFFFIFRFNDWTGIRTLILTSNKPTYTTYLTTATSSFRSCARGRGISKERFGENGLKGLVSHLWSLIITDILSKSEHKLIWWLWLQIGLFLWVIFWATILCFGYEFVQ